MFNVLFGLTGGLQGSDLAVISTIEVLGISRSSFLVQFVTPSSADGIRSFSQFGALANQ